MSGAAMLPIGSRVRGWTVTLELDAPGGWHELLAEDAAGGCVVLRVPPDLDGVAAIRVEADLARQHTHDALVQSVGLVEHNGWPVQVVEHVEGMTLEKLNLVGGRLPAVAVASLGKQVASALAELHERAPVVHHGSLGPDRVVVDGAGVARLLDVGRARLSANKRMMAPERRLIEGRPSAADDLWALGVMLADAALGGSVDVVASGIELARPALPARLLDALAALIAPVDARMTKASAAVRMFAEVERHLAAIGGTSGARALRDALQAAQLGAAAVAGDDEDSITVPDGKNIPFAGLVQAVAAVAQAEVDASMKRHPRAMLPVQPGPPQVAPPVRLQQPAKTVKPPSLPPSVPTEPMSMPPLSRAAVEAELAPRAPAPPAPTPPAAAASSVVEKVERRSRRDDEITANARLPSVRRRRRGGVTSGLVAACVAGGVLALMALLTLPFIIASYLG